MERREQCSTYVNGLLKNDKFTYDTDDRITINTKDNP